MDIVSVPASRGGVTVACVMEENLPAILSDVSRLRQVVINLVSNAIKVWKPARGRV
jgi:signal transduction histidine kinase